jgi:hypothetical protein
MGWMTRVTRRYLDILNFRYSSKGQIAVTQHLYGETVSWSLATASTAQSAIGRGSTPLGDTILLAPCLLPCLSAPHIALLFAFSLAHIPNQVAAQFLSPSRPSNPSHRAATTFSGCLSRYGSAKTDSRVHDKGFFALH